MPPPPRRTVVPREATIIRVEPALKDRLEEFAKHHDIPLNGVMRMALVFFLDLMDGHQDTINRFTDPEGPGLTVCPRVSRKPCNVHDGHEGMGCDGTQVVVCNLPDGHDGPHYDEDREVTW